MKLEIRICVELAQRAARLGFYLTADVYMRDALREANRSGNARHKAGCFRVRNKLRPLVAAQLATAKGAANVCR